MPHDPDRIRPGRVALVAFLVVIALVHGRALFTENVNWDEFALLQRAEIAARTGVISGGGRPGLGTLILLPFAHACANAARSIIHARVLWLVFVLGGAAAFVLLLRAMLPVDRHRWSGTATGLSLWVLAPDFLQHSIQVRTDQPAIFFGLWGGVCLVASRKRLPFAALSGVLFGVGFLFSQKLVYVAALAVLIATIAEIRARDLHVARELWRAGLSLLAFAVSLASYWALLSFAAEAPTLVPLEGALNAFAYYREFYGWNFFLDMVPTVLPQTATLAALVALTAAWAAGARPGNGSQILAAWGVALLGVAVALFHAGRFPYFYMVLGLFPAVVGALLVGPFLEVVRTRWVRVALITPFGAVLFMFAAAQSAASTADTVSHQVASIDFVNRNFTAGHRGFDGLGVFACRHDPEPFPVRFRQHLEAAREPDGGTSLGRDLVEKFRTRPVTFMIPPDLRYPDLLHEYWQPRYLQYWESIWVPGRMVGASGESTLTFDAPATGIYRWETAEPSARSLSVDGRVVAPADTITLHQGRHEVTVSGPVSGRIVWSLGEAGRPASRLFFRMY